MKAHVNRYLRAASVGFEEGKGGVPWLSCYGESHIADRMVRIAERYGIPVHDDPALADAFSKIPVDADIPQELFEPVAILLASFIRKNER